MKAKPLTILTMAGLLVVTLATTAAAQDQPNMVLMLADNMGYGDLGAYGSGGELRGRPTPRSDQLASEGRLGTGRPGDVCVALHQVAARAGAMTPRRQAVTFDRFT